MHPFASYVLRAYYKATGWNEDNLYANLTRSSNGTKMNNTRVIYSPNSSSSHSRLHSPSRAPFLYLQVSQCYVQDNILDGCHALTQWIRRIHIHFL
jgi:hypothetical protein